MYIYIYICIHIYVYALEKRDRQQARGVGTPEDALQLCSEAGASPRRDLPSEAAGLSPRIRFRVGDLSETVLCYTAEYP